VGNADGTCPVCSTSVLPIEDQVGWRNFSYKLTDEQLKSLENSPSWSSVSSRVTQDLREEVHVSDKSSSNEGDGSDMHA
jgi:hypothetical protein